MITDFWKKNSKFGYEYFIIQNSFRVKKSISFQKHTLKISPFSSKKYTIREKTLIKFFPWTQDIQFFTNEKTSRFFWDKSSHFFFKSENVTFSANILDKRLVSKKKLNLHLMSKISLLFKHSPYSRQFSYHIIAPNILFMSKISILFERHFCVKHHVSSIPKNDIFLSNILDKRSLSNWKTTNLFSCVGHHFYLP